VGGTTYRARWNRRLDSVCADPGQLGLVLHPVVDVAAGRIAGYEVLSRFPSSVPTEDWFFAARSLNRDADLDRVVLRGAMRLLDRVPHGAFLTVNASPTSLADPGVMAILQAQDLTGVVVELTEHTACDPRDLAEPLAELRDRGAIIALDDVGTGHSGLLRMAVVRPEILKVDLQLVRGLEDDLVKRSLVQFLGECASRLDAWIIAEGVETVAELDVLRGMGVPLVQGFLLARPGDGFAGLSAEALRLLHRPERPAMDPVRRTGDLARRTKTSHTVSAAVQVALEDVAPVVVLDVEDVPRVIVLPGQRPGERPRVETVDIRLAPETPVSEAAGRALARAVPVRFDPLVCTDSTGRYIGLVGVEDVVLDLAAGPAAQPRRLPWRMGA